MERNKILLTDYCILSGPDESLLAGWVAGSLCLRNTC